MIRRAVAADALEIAKLYKETIQTVNIKHYTLEQTATWANRGNDIERWLGKIDEQFFIISIERDQVLGFASLTTLGHIDLMFVHKNHQGQGVAKSLLLALEQEAAKLSINELTTEASITAKPFFQRQGFSVVLQQTVLIGEVAFTNYQMNKVVGKH